MRRRKDLPLLDYRAFCQEVTLYHRLPGPRFCCSRTVFSGAFVDWSVNRRTQQGGSRQEGCFLLVLPSGWQGRLCWLDPKEYDCAEPQKRAGHFTLAPGDLVFAGRGPELPEQMTPAHWAALTEQGAGAVKELALRFWQGRLCHVEAASGQELGRSGLPHPRKGMMR